MNWRRLGSTWLPSALVLAGLVVVALHYGESQRFAEMLRRAHPFWLLIAAILQVATYVCVAAIFKIGLRWAQLPARLRSLVPLGLAKLFIDQVVPTGGIGGTVLVIRALGRRGIPVGVATAVTVVGLLGFYVAYATSVTLCLVILWWRHDLSTAILTLATVVSIASAAVPVTLLWLTRGGVHGVPHWIRRIPGIPPVLDAMAAAPERTLHDRKLLLLAAWLQFMVFVLDAATLRAMLLALGLHVDAASVFASFILSSIAASIPLFPGGVGPFEAVSVATLRVLGVPLEASVAGTLLLRGFTLWVPMIPGLWFARREMAAANRTAAAT